MVLKFTAHDGSIMEVNDYASPVGPPPPVTVTPEETPHQKESKLSSEPTVPTRHSDDRASSPLFTMHSEKSNLPLLRGLKSVSSPQNRYIPQMIYNEYGELVDPVKELQPVNSATITVLQAMRLIQKTFRHEYKDKMCLLTAVSLASAAQNSVTVDSELKRNAPLPSPHRLTTWQLISPVPPWPKLTPSILEQALPDCNGPPRVLEIGCDDGQWCAYVKKKKPDWIIHGLDDVDRWSAHLRDCQTKDFMEPIKKSPVDGYFDGIHLNHSHPAFTVRNLNGLISDPNPFPQRSYDMVRGRYIFDHVESYKSFLEDVRLILQPDGVVEFLEVDPRPRFQFAGRRRSEKEHRNKSENDWTDIIADRFRDPSDVELVTDMPALTKRVEARLNAKLRPKDGVAAQNLKSWLQGAGFYNTKQIIVRVPIGGVSQAGLLLINLLKWQSSLEDSIPVLKSTLPEIDYDELNCANFYINIHLVTARKPHCPHAGDLMKDGTRLEMTPRRESAMNRLNDAESNQWQRFNLDEKLTGLLESLMSLDAGLDLNTLGPPEGAGRKHRRSVSEGIFGTE